MKPQQTRSKGNSLLELFLDASLLLLFSLLAFILGCLLSYGYIPVPRDFGNARIAQLAPTGFRLEADSIRLKLSGEVELSHLKIWSDSTQQPIFEADGAVVRIQAPREHHFRPSINSLVLANGTLFLPAVYSPDGLRNPILERIALRLQPTEDLLRIDSFAARHDQIQFRGAVEWPRQATTRAPIDPNTIITRFYQYTATALKEKARFNNFTRPTLAFDLSVLDDQSVKIVTRLSSPELRHPKVTGQNFRIDAALRIKNDSLIADSSLLLQAEQLQIPQLELSTQSLRGRIAQDDWQTLLRGDWPDLKLAAQKLQIHGIDLDAPIVDLHPQAYPIVDFSGSTNSLDGALAFSGKLHSDSQSGTVDLQGNLDLLALLPANYSKKLPPLSFDQAPYYNMSLSFNEGFALQSANLDARTDALTLHGITFDHIRADTSFCEGRFAIDDLYLRRGSQWLDLNFSLDTTTSEYRVALIGSAIPYDYNPILPRWWAGIFRDFDFSDVEDSLGDFIIYGNTKEQAARLYYGHARAKQVRYQGVHLDRAELVVRGRGSYAECHQIKAHSGEGWARGNIAFASFADHVSAPASIRLDFKSHLKIQDAQKLFGSNIAKILGDFETDSLPTTTLKGAIFNNAYPQFRGKTFFNLVADSGGPIQFKGVPLDYLKFALFGRDSVTYLRDLNFGYADGSGSANVDILTAPDTSPELRFQFSLHQADQSKAIRGLPQLKPTKSQLTDDDIANKQPPTNARVDMNLHARGPANDPYQYSGYGDLSIHNEALGSIQLLGPLSRLLKNTPLSFTSFNLDTVNARFELKKKQLHFNQLQIDGPRTRIRAPGSIRLDNQALDMRVSVHLFANLGAPTSKFKEMSELLKAPIPNLLEFQLSGTMDEQKWRSLYDPRNLIPGF